MGGAIVILVFYIAIIILVIAALWRVFEKAGKPGWAAIVPIYNFVVLCQIAGKPEWWVVLMLIPFVGIIIAIMVYAGVAERFGMGGGFVVGLIFLPFIFFPILGFGSAQYIGAGRGGPPRRRRPDYDDDYDDDDDRPRRPRRPRDDY